MKDIAFHLTDIAENGVRAGAGQIDVLLRVEGRELVLRIGDDGCGMEPQTLKQVLDPFYTTRTTRRVGLGLPFLVQNAEQCGGRVEVRSEPGRGTEVEARFPLDHIDCPPLGDLASTLMQLVIGHPEVNFRIRMQCGGRSEMIATSELREALDGIPLGHPQVAVRIRELFAGLSDEVFGNELG